MQIIVAILGSSLLTTILTRIFTVCDRKKDKQDEILKSIKEVKDELHDHKDADDRDKADTRRMRILQFSDDIHSGINHSEEAFNTILEDIDKYVSYCNNHEDTYVNSKAEASISNIKEVYNKCIRGELEFL